MEQNRALISVVILACLLPSTSEASQYRDLCPSVPAACEWSGPDAPVLRADVCWSSSTGIHIKGSAPCPTNQKAFYVEHGEVVDPSGLVYAYVPLDRACDTPGICLEGPPPDGSTEMAICCEFGICVDIDIVPCNSANSIIYSCEHGASNQDGTVDCYEGEQIWP